MLTMSTPETSKPHKWQTIFEKRTKARNTNYQLIKIIKAYNQNKKPIGFNQLCALTDQHAVAKFLKDAYAWEMIENRFVGVDGHLDRRLLEVTSVGDAFIKYCEKQGKQE